MISHVACSNVTSTFVLLAEVIMSFAGSIPNPSQRLRSSWPGAGVASLRTNYRSTDAILRTACRALRAEDQPPKRMVRVERGKSQSRQASATVKSGLHSRPF